MTVAAAGWRAIRRPSAPSSRRGRRVAFGGLYGDCGNYKGALVSVATDGSGDPDLYIVPTRREAGIWTPGGPVVDEHGDVWVTTGNSESESAFDYGNAVIRLTAALSP